MCPRVAKTELMSIDLEVHFPFLVLRSRCSVGVRCFTQDVLFKLNPAVFLSILDFIVDMRRGATRNTEARQLVEVISLSRTDLLNCHPSQIIA
jgi:hypothetical protein